MALSTFYLLRLALLAGIIQAAQIGLVALITRNLGTTISRLFAKPVAVLLPLIVPAILAAFALYWLGVRLLETAARPELALAPALINLSIGIGSGALLFAAVFGAIAAEGAATYEGYAGFWRVPAAALIFTAGVVFEN
jgi:hypothetical protein